MPSIKISALTEKATMAGTEEVLINDSGTSKKFSTQRFLDIKTASETAKTAAETAETNAETAETNASGSATSASGSATTATAQAVIATTKAGEASTSATNATNSETNAATSETNAATSASTATTQAGIATTKAGEASTQATNAATSETNAGNSATSASGSASTATTQASNASSSASTATTQASNASGSATSASNSASSATTAQAAAEAARDSALAAFDSFDDRYLGQKASDPTTDNDGNALVAGTLYFNTTSDDMKVYEGSAWVAAYASLSGALLQTNNLSDLNNAGTARTNLGVDAAGTVNYTHQATHSTSEIADNAITAAKLSVTGNGTSGQYLGSDADGTFTWTSISADPTMGGDLSGTASNAQLGSNVVTDTELNSAKLNGIESGATADQTNAQIKTAYEANANSNEFSDAEQSKLAGIATSANNYSLPSSVVHDTEKGSLHATDALRLSGHTVSLYKGDGTSESVTIPDNNTTYSVGDNGLTQKNFTTTLWNKLDGIATSANNYSHPTHAGDDFSVDTGALSGATVVSDIDINVTTDSSGHVTDANGTVSTRTLTLANLGYTGATNANYITNNNQLTNGSGYTTNTGDITNVSTSGAIDGGGSSGSVTISHSTSAGNKHVPTGGSTGQILTNTASGTGTWQDAAGGGGGYINVIKGGSSTVSGSLTVPSGMSSVIISGCGGGGGGGSNCGGTGHGSGAAAWLGRQSFSVNA